MLFCSLIVKLIQHIVNVFLGHCFNLFQSFYFKQISRKRTWTSFAIQRPRCWRRNFASMLTRTSCASQELEKQENEEEKTYCVHVSVASKAKKFTFCVFLPENYCTTPKLIIHFPKKTDRKKYVRIFTNEKEIVWFTFLDWLYLISHKVSRPNFQKILNRDSTMTNRKITFFIHYLFQKRWSLLYQPVSPLKIRF